MDEPASGCHIEKLFSRPVPLRFDCTDTLWPPGTNGLAVEKSVADQDYSSARHDRVHQEEIVLIRYQCNHTMGTK